MRNKHGEVVLVSSGLGPELGGVGVVSEHLKRSWEKVIGAVHVQLHQAHRHAPVRYGRLALEMLFHRARSRPTLVFYEHVDLARMHSIAPWLANVPYGIFVHGVEVWRELDCIRRRALTGASLLIANSGYTISRARANNPWMPEAQVAWLGVCSMDPGPRLENRPCRVVMLGRMAAGQRHKGHDEVLSAWPRIRAAVPEAELLIVGGGDGRERLERRVETERISGVNFTGFVTRDTRNNLLRGSRVLLAPSVGEGFGLAACEAALAQVAVVVLGGTVANELFAENEVFFLRDRSPSEMASAAITLLKDPERASQLSAAGKARVEGNYLVHHFEARAAGILKAFLEGSNRRWQNPL